jgi:hypothetical protein
MSRLTVKTIDQLLDLILLQRVSELDLSNVRFIDPYALLILVLCIRKWKEEGFTFSVNWPRSPRVRGWMQAMRFPQEVHNVPNLKADKQILPETLQPITPVVEEGAITGLVVGFSRRLSERYPLTEGSRSTLLKVMIELFQNIPQHSNATGEVHDPHGLAAMQDYPDSIFLAVADKGIGLRRSLALRRGFTGLGDKGALNKIVFGGMSRFTDPGRGGELQRIAQLVYNWNGMLTIRSGEAILYMDAEYGDVYDAPPFPGVQIAIDLPRHVLWNGPPSHC